MFSPGTLISMRRHFLNYFLFNDGVFWFDGLRYAICLGIEIQYGVDLVVLNNLFWFVTVSFKLDSNYILST